MLPRTEEGPACLLLDGTPGLAPPGLGQDDLPAGGSACFAGSCGHPLLQAPWPEWARETPRSWAPRPLHSPAPGTEHPWGLSTLPPPPRVWLASAAPWLPPWQGASAPPQVTSRLLWGPTRDLGSRFTKSPVK